MPYIGYRLGMHRKRVTKPKMRFVRRGIPISKKAKAHLSLPMRNAVKAVVKRQAETKFQQATINGTALLRTGIFTYQPLYYIVQGPGAKDRQGDQITDIHVSVKYNWYAQAGYWNSGGGAESPHPQGVNVRCMIIRTEIENPSVGANASSFFEETVAGGSKLFSEFVDPNRVYISHIAPDNTYNTSIVKSKLNHSKVHQLVPTSTYAAAVAAYGTMSHGHVTFTIPSYRYIDGGSNKYGSKWNYLVCFIADFDNSSAIITDAVGKLECEILTKYKDM